jgi:hypothetical protein
MLRFEGLDGGSVNRAIFISYRRDDTEGEAGRLFDDLVRSFGEGSVFMDVAGINPGIDFRKAIDENVATCGVLLAMIGPGWTTIANGSGQRRLDDANDFVRLEVASALARNIAVIPVLVHEAKMPRPDLLPDNLKDLAFRNSVEITHTRWNSDVQLLIKALSQYVASSSATSTEPVHATVPVQLPPANAPADPTATARNSKMPLIAGALAVLIVAIGVGAYFMLHHDDATPRPIAPAPVATQSQAASTAPGPATTNLANQLVGTWVIDGANAMTGTSEDPSPPKKQNELARLKASLENGAIRIHGWGLCHKCDWGTQVASIVGADKAVAIWDFAKLPGSGEAKDSSRVAQVTIVPAGNKLSVQVQNAYSDRGPNSRRSQFERISNAP